MGKRITPKRAAPKPAKAKTHTTSEDGLTVTRHHEEGDSVQSFSTTEAAKQYAASIK